MPSREIYWEEYVRRTVAQFRRDSISTWVVWDRPDAASFNATPEQYAEQMLDVAHKAALEANPNAKLVSGAVTRENIEALLDRHFPIPARRAIPEWRSAFCRRPRRFRPKTVTWMSRWPGRNACEKQERIVPELWALNLAWPSGDDPVPRQRVRPGVVHSARVCHVPRTGRQPDHSGLDHTEVSPRRDSADLIFPEGSLFGIKPAAISAKVARAIFDKTTFVRELFLNDRSDGLARAYLFQRDDGKLLLAAWRREGQQYADASEHARICRRYVRQRGENGFFSEHRR